MQILTASLGFIFALALLGVLGLGVYWGLLWLIDLLPSLDPQVAAVTGVLSVILLLAARIVAGDAGRTARQALAGQMQVEKAGAYSLLLDLWELHFRLGPTTDPADADGRGDAMRALDLRLALYGSHIVIADHRRLTELQSTGRLVGDEGRAALLSAVRGIRRELGTPTTGLGDDALGTLLFRAKPQNPAAAAAAAAAPPTTDEPVAAVTEAGTRGSG